MDRFTLVLVSQKVLETLRLQFPHIKSKILVKSFLIPTLKRGFQL